MAQWLDSPVQQGVLSLWAVGARCLDEGVSSSYAGPFTRLSDALDEIAANNPAFRSTHEKQHLMTGPARPLHGVRRPRPTFGHACVNCRASEIIELTSLSSR